MLLPLLFLSACGEGVIAWRLLMVRGIRWRAAADWEGGAGAGNPDIEGSVVDGAPREETRMGGDDVNRCCSTLMLAVVVDDDGGR